ncbi:hypothetical protein [Actimicrobium sp. CCI2.3]|uniref:hypothetical protein n=1 Tax=Actimicrobium sp. CCI2.3 TaxID=3048616 RepID=UPI002B253F20|nr:hypothetical protein [Actimicrobium sp. CCI2.3]MEB0020970.1 hypothetical protein [Actimicrobium sp. CCI2.3]
MSLLSPNTLALYVAPDRIQSVRTAGLRRRPVAADQHDASVQADDNWHGLVAVGTELVRASQARRLHVVLSDKLARYACVSWRPELRNAQEDLAMAALNFDDVHGAGASADWHFGFSTARPGQSRLSIAIPKTLFAQLQDNLGLARCQVASIQTAFSATLQAHRKVLGSSGWLMNLEDGRLTLGCWTKHVWNWVYSVHADIHSPEDLLQRVRQEIMLAATRSEAASLLQIFVHAPALEHLPFGTLSGVQFIVLKTPPGEPGVRHAFALLGARA